MSRSNWFAPRRLPSSRRTAGRRKPSPAARRRKSNRLQLESLEERRVLAAMVTTDLADYAPGATAHVFASEFAVGETVEFQVLHTDGGPNTGGGHEPWQVTDGLMGDFNGDGTMDGDLDGVADGNIHTTWYVNPDDSADATFELTANGLSSGLSASHTFTDSVTFAGTPSVSSSSSSRSSATLSNHTVGAGTDRLLVVTVLTRGDEDVSSITYNGQSLTQAIERDGGDDDETAVEIWYLKMGTSASSTTANVVVSFSSNVDPSYIRADNLTGVDQTTPIGATAGTTGNDDDVSVNITTTTAGSLVYGAVAMFGGDTDPFETGSGLTQLFDSATGSSSSSEIGVWGAFRTAATAGTYNFSAEANTGDDYAVGVIEIRMTQAVAEAPAINVVKRVNGNDANTAGAGPTLAAGGTATFTYSVTNTGNVALSNVTIVDDNGTPAVPGDNFSPTFTGGDTNSNSLLDLTETWTYSATRTVIAGQYTNIATASGKSPGNTTVGDTDQANYFGSAPALNIETSVNGQDADSTTGPLLTPGGTATFTYVVTNTGNIAVGGISVVDNNGTPGNAADDFNPNFTGGDTNSNGLLDLGENWNYSSNRFVVAGQYTGAGRVSGSVAATGQTVSDTDPTNYFGSQPGIDLQVFANSIAIGSGMGVVLPTGTPITLEYHVSNIGNVPLSNVLVSDDNGNVGLPGDDFSPTFIGGDTNSNGLLDLGEIWKYTVSAAVPLGQYSGAASATGIAPGNQTVTDTSPTNRFGVSPGIQVVKRVNGDDANSATGPVLVPGTIANFTFEVTNTGNMALFNVNVSDDSASPTYISGDTDGDHLLDLTETWQYTASGTVLVGQHTNTATASGRSDFTLQFVSDTDTANYFGAAPGINLVKKVNGQDANSATGPIIPIGSAANFTYEVSNTGNIALGSVVVVDDNGTPGNGADDFTPSFTGGDANSNSLLDLGETWTYSATHTVFVGQYSNIGTASGSVAATGQSASDTDAAFHFGKAAPEILTLAVTTPINENDTATLSGTYTHDGLFSSHQLDIDWNGDGIYDQTVAVTAGSFSVGHQFADDNPTGTASDTHNLNVRLRDDDTGEDTGNVNLTINNVAPEILTLLITTPISEGGTATLSGTYSDVGTLDTHELDIDWNGDGIYDQTVAVTAGSFSVGHQFADDNPTGTASDTHNLNVRLRDDDTGEDTGNVNLTINNVAPEILTLLITTPISEGGTATLSGTYSDVGTLDTHELDIDWNGDGIYDQTIAVGGGSFSATKQFLDDNPSGTASDTHSVNVRLRDDDTGADTDNAALTINNLPPEIQSLAIVSPIFETESATLTGTYTDAGTQDTHWLDIDWNGDGFYEQTIAVAGGSFSISNQYNDDNPTGTPSDTFNVQVRLRDDDSGFSTAGASFTVNNVAPEITALSIGSPIQTGQSASLSGTYTDVGPFDTHQLDIDWNGDGTYDQTVAVAGGSFAVAHTFTTAGNFNVTARLRDDDTGSDTASAALVVRSRPVIVLAPDKGNTSKPIVKVVNQETGKIVSQFYAFESKFLGGVQVAAADMTGDGIDEIIVASGQGRVGEVRVFTQLGVELTQFRVLPYGSTYTGGVEVAVGDVDADGDNDIVTVTKFGRPDVRAFCNCYNTLNPSADAVEDAPIKQFFAFDAKFKGGADVVVADMGTFYNGHIYDAYTPDGRSEIIVANGPGMVSTIHVYDVSAAPKIVDTIMPLSSKFKGGITLSTARINGDAIPDLIVAAGNGGGSAVEIWSGLASDVYDARLAAFSAFGDQATKNMPVHATALDTNGDGIADLLAVVQGTNGKSNQLRYFNTYGSLQGIHYGFNGPWNIASLKNADPSLPLDTKYDIAAKDDVYSEIGTTTTTKPAKKAKKKGKK